MDLVDKEDRTLAALTMLKRSFLRHPPDVRDARGNGIEGHEAGLAPLCDQMGKRGLACSGRSIEDERHEPVGLDGPAQKLALAENMVLPHVLGKVAGPHSPGKRCP